jgi:geranylgeranyl diphosphate synthase, type I
LVIDDLQDSAMERRGEKALHILVAEKIKKLGWHEGRDEQDSREIVLLEATARMHEVGVMLGSLASGTVVDVRDIYDTTMTKTARGQIQDIELSGRLQPASLDEILNMMSAKTGLYSVLGPLQIGMALAGRGQEDLDAITGFALKAGVAFQIANDLKIVAEPASADDIKGNKQTLLTYYVLNRVGESEAEELQRMLGNQDLTDEEFVRCQEIFRETGAVDFAQWEMTDHMRLALRSIDREAHRWTPDGVAYLKFLTNLLIEKSSHTSN